MKLSLASEEVAMFFAQMLDHEYTTKKVFRENFFKDWRKVKMAKCSCKTRLSDFWILSIHLYCPGTFLLYGVVRMKSFSIVVSVYKNTPT